ncbi:hypothetical protein BST61_g1977 [Cercospora zeina]
MITGDKPGNKKLRSNAHEEDATRSCRSTKKQYVKVATDDSLSSTNAAVVERTKHIFPFFDLPRELRDMIYDETRELRITKVKTESGLLASWSFLVPRNTTVCRQFHSEATQRIEKVPELTLTDTSAFLFDEPAPLSPQLWPPTLMLHLAVKDFPHDLADHERWIKPWLERMSDLQVLRIRMQVDCPHEAMLVETIVRSQFWLHLKNLQELHVLRVDRELFDFADASSSRPLATWTSESGELMRVV